MTTFELKLDKVLFEMDAPESNRPEYLEISPDTFLCGGSNTVTFIYDWHGVLKWMHGGNHHRLIKGNLDYYKKIFGERLIGKSIAHAKKSEENSIKAGNQPQQRFGSQEEQLAGDIANAIGILMLPDNAYFAT